MMAALLDPRIALSFQNTGREHQKTLDFLRRLEDALGRQIQWLEFRRAAPPGAPPKAFVGFERVTYDTCVKRSNDLFVAMLDAYNDYRDAVAKKRLTPWWRNRLCTALLKIAVKEAWIRSQQVESFDDIVGLRADEPERVARIKDRETSTRCYRTPLASANLTETDVMSFWSAQEFDLELSPAESNCTACFLKSEGDVSRALGEEETDADGWIALQEQFPGFGFPRPSYKQLRAERPLRLAMEQHFRGELPFVPPNDGSLTQRRYRNLYFQEKERFHNGVAKFSCACEGARALADGDLE